MKCPVCDNVNESMVCVRCGFDSSRDYEKYPTFGPVGKGPAVSALREKPMPPKPVKPKVPVWLMAAACALMMAAGIGIGAGINKPEPTEPSESVQMQEPVETTTDPAEATQSVGLTESEPWRNNVLRSDEMYEGYEGDWTAYPVFGSDYRREQISSVTVLDTLADMPEDAWDVSETGNGTVMAWVKPNGELYDLYIGAEGGVSAGSSCVYLFGGYKRATSINLGDRFDTSNVENMHEMFYNCAALKELTLGELFDTSNVQDMGWMFDCCISLRKLTLGDKFDTSNVRDMTAMIGYCPVLTELSLGECFDTSNVQNMGSMFRWCSSLTELNLGEHFDTSNVQDMRRMFNECFALTALDLGDKFVTTKADTTGMFDDCPAGADYQHLLH